MNKGSPAVTKTKELSAYYATGQWSAYMADKPRESQTKFEIKKGKLVLNEDKSQTNSPFPLFKPISRAGSHTSPWFQKKTHWVQAKTPQFMHERLTKITLNSGKFLVYIPLPKGKEQAQWKKAWQVFEKAHLQGKLGYGLLSSTKIEKKGVLFTIHTEDAFDLKLIAKTAWRINKCMQESLGKWQATFEYVTDRGTQMAIERDATEAKPLFIINSQNFIEKDTQKKGTKFKTLKDFTKSFKQNNINRASERLKMVNASLAKEENKGLEEIIKDLVPEMKHRETMKSVLSKEKFNWVYGSDSDGENEVDLSPKKKEFFDSLLNLARIASEQETTSSVISTKNIKNISGKRENKSEKILNVSETKELSAYYASAQWNAIVPTKPLESKARFEIKDNKLVLNGDASLTENCPFTLFRANIYSGPYTSPWEAKACWVQAKTPEFMYDRLTKITLNSGCFLVFIPLPYGKEEEQWKKAWQVFEKGHQIGKLGYGLQSSNKISEQNVVFTVHTKDAFDLPHIARIAWQINKCMQQSLGKWQGVLQYKTDRGVRMATLEENAPEAKTLYSISSFSFIENAKHKGTKPESLKNFTQKFIANFSKKALERLKMVKASLDHDLETKRLEEIHENNRSEMHQIMSFIDEKKEEMRKVLPEDEFKRMYYGADNSDNEDDNDEEVPAFGSFSNYNFDPYDSDPYDSDDIEWLEQGIGEVGKILFNKESSDKGI